MHIIIPKIFYCKNGGMCMHDEAPTHYIDMIYQTTLRHRFIKEEFGLTPRIEWQIESYGHSAMQAYLLGVEVPFCSIIYKISICWLMIKGSDFGIDSIIFLHAYFFICFLNVALVGIRDGHNSNCFIACNRIWGY